MIKMAIAGERKIPTMRLPRNAWILWLAIYYRAASFSWRKASCIFHSSSLIVSALAFSVKIISFKPLV